MVKAKRSLSGLQRIYEAGLILVIVIAVFVFFSLVTFSSSDPSWSQTAWQGPVQNATGPAGAWLSDLLLFSFGYFAYFIPVAMVVIGWSMFWHPRPKYQIDYVRAGVRIIGFLFSLLGISGLASINFNDFYLFSSGGLIGDLTVRAMLPLFGLLGTTLLLLFAVAAGFTLLTGISWIYIVDLLGKSAIATANWLYHLPERVKEIRHKVQQKVQQKAHRFGDDNDPLFASKSYDEAQCINSDIDREPQLNSPVNANSGTNEREHQIGFSAIEKSEPIIAANDANIDEPAKTIADDSATVSHQIEPTFGEIDIPLDQEDEPVLLNKVVGDDFDPNGSVEFNPDELDEPLVVANYDHSVSYSDVSDSSVSAHEAALDQIVVDGPAPQVEPDFVELQNLQANSVAEPSDAGGEPEPDSSTGDPLPSFELLDRPNRTQDPISSEELEGISRLVELKLLDFNIQASVVAVFPGPVVTRFELELAPGVKVAKISALNKDLARALSAISVRVVEVIPGKSVIGLELPNKHREIVYLSEVLGSGAFDDAKSNLSMVLGKDISGEPTVVDLAKMPHLLVAGTTGSGKSVGVNVMILSLLYKSTPEQVRMIMIDPKMLELSVYSGIPHLLSEVVTDMKEAANALRWCVGEMERRYKLMSALGVRNLAGFNEKIKMAKTSGHPIYDPLWKPGESMEEHAPELEHLPSIVVIVDEFADMMMIVGKKVEELIARIAQKARAAGIHLILATQRPSVDVITGLIKANIPTRIAFQVSSKIDSRTILDQQGAESLLGQGDMLYLPPGTGVPTRVHGAFVDDDEVHRVVADWKARGKPNYIPEILEGEMTGDNILPGEKSESDQEYDPLYDEALAFVTESRRGSVSGVQRKLKIGYNRAARIIEQMEQDGVVSAPGHNGNRDVLAPPPVNNDY